MNLQWGLERFALRKALSIAGLAMIFAQLYEVQAFVYYVPKILKNNGLDGIEWQHFIGSARAVAIVMAQLLADRVGRRASLLLSAPSMSLCIAFLRVIV